MSNSDSELEEDEEEILVYVEFDNCATNDVFSSENLKLDMLGLDSEHPVMQVNGKFFEGTYADAVGTYLFFEKDDNPVIDDPIFDKVPTVKYFAKTRKVLKMQRAFVVPRYEVVGDSEHNESVPNIETIKEAGVPPRYQEEALSFWKNARNKRVHALNEYLRKQEFRKELRQRGFEPESESDDDNPFAMYKYLENESEVNKIIENEDDNIDLETQIENLENTLQMTELNTEETLKTPKKLTVIDPGPSTSKSSMPWIDEDDITEEKPIEKSMIHKVKSVGKVKQKTIKGKVHKKTFKKRKSSLSQKSPSESSGDQHIKIYDTEPLVSEETGHLDLDDKLNESDRINKSDIVAEAADENLEKQENITNKKLPKNKVEEMEVDESLVEESGRLLAGELKLTDSFVTDKEKRKQERRKAKMREISEKLKAQSQCSTSQPNS